MSACKPDDLMPVARLARSFASRELAGKVAGRDRYPFGGFDEGLLEKAHEAGFLNVTLPVEAGDAGYGMKAFCEILRCLCEIDASPAGILFTNTLAHKVLTAAGEQEMLQRLFSQAVSVKDRLMAFPAYANPAHTDTLPQAQRAGAGNILTGQMKLLVLGNIARQAVVPSRTGHGTAYSFFLVDLDDQGVEKGEPVFTLGLHGCPAVDAAFHGVKAEPVGNENEGRDYFDQILPEMSAAAAAMNAGILRGTYLEALAYTKQREQGGKTIAGWSEVARMLADLSIKADVAEMCVYQSCRELEQKQRGYASRVASASLHVSWLACEGTTDGIQILGGYGYMKDYGQEKRYRDARMVQALLGAAPLRKLDMLRQDQGGC